MRANIPMSLMFLLSFAPVCFALTDTLSLSEQSNNKAQYDLELSWNDNYIPGTVLPFLESSPTGFQAEWLIGASSHNHFDLNQETLPPNLSTAVSDSGSPENTPHRKLLPDQMGLWETFLWGEHGVLRFGQLTPESRKKELAWRNTMLQVHQAMGLVTWGSMVTTLVLGQLYLNGNNRLGRYHTTAASITEVLYAGTAALALFSPPPLIRRSETSTITVHKTLAYIHAAGMILLPILAQNIRQRNGHSGFLPINVSRARAHQITGYITTATFTAAILIVTF